MVRNFPRVVFSENAQVPYAGNLRGRPQKHIKNAGITQAMLRNQTSWAGCATQLPCLRAEHTGRLARSYTQYEALACSQAYTHFKLSAGEGGEAPLLKE